MNAGAVRLRALILEDRVDDAEVMVMHVTEGGYDVEWSRVDTPAAFEAALSPDLDVILADFSLPSFDVMRALDTVRERDISVPLIIVSGTISEENAVACLKRGAADYLVKDRLGRLPQAIRAAVEQRRLRDEQRASVADLRRTAAELAEANEALRRADVTKDHLLAMTAHELRTPLTSILGFSSLLVKEWDARDGDRGRQWCEIIERQTRRLIAHVEDLLTFTRIEAGALELHVEMLELAPVVERVLAALELDQLFTVSIPPQTLVWVDPRRLDQVLTNLLTNAAKHGAAPYSVSSAVSGSWVEVRVCDEGPGVPEAFVPRLFEKYAQAQDTAASGGLGLGLAITRSLVEAHGGSVWYRQNEPKGACFGARFPIPQP